MDDFTSDPSCNAFALRQATRSVSNLYDQYVGRCGLTGPQYSILSHISRNPHITIQALADKLVLDRTSLLRALQPLTRDGYVLHAPSPDSPRKQVLALSSTGQAKYVEAYKLWQQAQAEFESKVGGEEAKALRDALFKLTRMLNS